MDLLVIGIDGGTKAIIDGMPMPFTQSLFNKSYFRTLEEDPLSRGWAEALTGCHASETKGFYLMPYLDGSYDFNRAYSKNVIVAESPKLPLWKMVNNKGKSVGILNVPTTGPAANVDGFIVSGGGGGLNSIGGIPEGMYYPESVKSILAKNNYVFDIRLPNDAKTICGFIEKIADAEVIQKNTFIELSDKNKPDFGFYCIRMITEIQYLARYEIERCIQSIKIAKESGQEFFPENDVQEALINYYKKVDEHIKEVFQSVMPEEFLFIGDHSTALFKKDLNLDVWLESNKFLSLMSPLEGFVHKVKHTWHITKLLNKVGIKRKWQKRPTRLPITKFSRKNSLAFSTFYETGNFAGIFINDAHRFNGPVKNDEIDALVNSICESFNEDPDTKRHNLHAVPYRRKYKESRFFDFMPDIQVHKPDTTFCSGRYWEFLRDNPNCKAFKGDPVFKPYGSPEAIQFPHTGLKGSDPLFVYSKNLESFIERDDPNDLRMAYSMIDRYLSQKESS